MSADHLEHPYVSVNPALAGRVADALTSLFPVTSDDGKWELRASNITVQLGKFNAKDLRAHQQARVEAGDRTVPITAELALVNEGKVVERRKGKIGDMPLMGITGSFLVGGNDWFVPMAQQRRKPGAYTREKNNGEFETQIQVPKMGMFRLTLDPERGVLKFGHGTTNADWYGIVKAMGASDDEVKKAIGPQLLEINRKPSYDKDVDKIYGSLFDRNGPNAHLVKAGILPEAAHKSLDMGSKVVAMSQALGKANLDPFVTSRTLGEGFTDINKDMLLAAAKRLVHVQRGEEKPDDLDAPEFKTAEGVDDMLPERIRGKVGKFLTYGVKRLLGKGLSLSKIITPTWANPGTVGYFGGAKGFEGGLAHTAEIANPLALLSERSKLTPMGEGGIQETRAITDSARLVRPTAAGFIDLVHTPEGSEIGITTHAAANVRKVGKTLETLLCPVKNGVVDWKTSKYVSVETAADSVVSYSEFWSRETGKPLGEYVRANKGGQVHDDINPKEVDYVLPSGGAMFDHTSNSALFLANTHAVRGMMAGKHLVQALPLVNREVPLATLKTAKGQDYFKAVGQTFTVASDVDGVVESVKPDCITVSGVKHWLFDHYPMQAKVGLHHVPVVKVGDHVKKDQLLADTNYSKDGRMALGVNLRSAYTPWRNGGGYEDAIPISESASTKLTSEHIHRETLWLDEGVTVGSKMFRAQFPTQMTADNLAKLDESGVIKVGQEVKPHEILAAAVQKKEFDERDRTSKNLANIHKMLQRPYRNAALVWDEDYVGKVLRVTKLSDRIEVHLLTHEPARVGDKLSMSSAAKGTISAVIPDDQMPRDEKGRPIEVLFNPIGVLNRINPSQTIEQAAGKLVRDGGEKYEFVNFEKDDAAEVAKRLKAKGIKHEEYLYDPTTGRKTERPVAVGYNYVVKLDHPVRKKFSARGRDGYTMDEAPTSGKGKGGQSFDQLTSYSLLGHDAHAILGESVGIRGTKNDDFWEAYQAGETPPPPKVPFAFEKLRNYMTAMGIHTEQKGHVLHYMPLTEAHIMEQSHGEITNARQVRAENLAAEKGGLFDEDATGGLFGDKWAHITLPKPMPHPLYEKVVRELCGLTQAEFYGLLGETMHLDARTGKVVAGVEGGLTGPSAFKHLLAFDIDAKLKETKEKLKTAVGSDANKYHRITQYLRGLKTTGMRPEQAYMTSLIPVVPPKYRSIIELPNHTLKVADSNLLYRDAILTRNLLNEAGKDKSLPPSEMGKARIALYDTYAAIVGVGQPLTERRDEELKGFAQIIKGKTNKTGLFQSQLARRRNDYTGRSTIEPDANLGPDEIGIPEEMAWVMYEPRLVRRMVRGGWRPAEAAEEVRKRSMAARNMLMAELKAGPVAYSRAPSLHRWSIGSAMPFLTQGREIKISPLVVGPYNADYDGDQQIGMVFVLHPATVDVGGSPVAARFHTAFPVVAPGEAISLLDLQDVPHGAVRGVTQGKNGKIAFFDASPGLRVLAYDKSSAGLVWAPLDGWSEHYDREVEIVELSSGHQIITDDDPRAVYGLLPATLAEARSTPTAAVGTVVVPRQVRELPKFASITEIAVPEHIRPTKVSGIEAWTLPASIPLTEEFGYLVGAFLGDGWVSGPTTAAGERRPRQVHLAGSAEDSVLSAFQAALQTVFPGISASRVCQTKEGEAARLGDCARDTYCSAELARLLDWLCGHGARGKHLPAWFLAAPEAFRRGLFCGLMDTDGSIAVSHGKAKPQLMGGYTSTGLRLVREVRLLANSLGIRGRISGFKYKKHAGLDADAQERTEQAWQLTPSTVDLVAWGGRGMHNSKKLAAFVGVQCNPESPAAAKADMVPWPRDLALALSQGLNRVDLSLYTCLRRPALVLSRLSAERAIAIVGEEKIRKMPLGAQWLQIVQNRSVTWDTVVSVEKTGIRETGYDLTVPGYETFVSIDGIVLSNTMLVHPPITEKAQKEAFNLLPSNNLLYDKDRSLAYGVDKDIVAGIFALTRQGRPSSASFKTTAEAIKAYQDNKQSLMMDSLVKVGDRQGQWTIGQLIFFSLVPAQFSAGIAMPVDGTKLKAMLTRVAKEAPAQYNRISRAISQAGFEAAARSGGITATVNELVLDRGRVNRLLKSFQQELASVKGYAAKQKAADELFHKKYKPQFDKIVEEHFDDKDIGYATLAASGAGKRNLNDSLQQFLVSPGLVQDVHDEVVPAVITSSYGSGMKPSDYMLTSPGARAGMIAKSLMTAKPGYLAKEIAASMGPVRIGEADCKTQRGIEQQLDEPDVDLLDRHLLKDVPGTAFKRNDIVTPEMLSRLRDSKKTSIWVRSPMTCEADSPPCQMCAGRRADGNLHPIGSNIGYNYGQAVSERSTQLTLKSFHSGGSYGAGHGLLSGFSRLQELLKAPEIIHEQGTLASIAGKVTDVKAAPQGGTYVTVGDTQHYLYPARTKAVKVGDKVSAGDPLSDGSFRPQDIAKHKGLLAAQQYVVNEAREAYSTAGATVRKPVLEVLAAGVLRYVKVTNDGGEKDLAIGDVLHENDYQKRKARNPVIQAEPIILGLGSKPLATSKDLLERLNFEHLTESMQQVPAMAGQSDLTGSKSPIPGLAYGAAFRR